LTIKTEDTSEADKSKVAAASSAVPAVKATPDQGVYVLEKDASGKLRVKFVVVKTGITGATDIEVVSGLTDGQEIVTGPFKTLRGLKNNALVKRDTAKPAAQSSGGNA
jgi:HlyD family secretion protein